MGIKNFFKKIILNNVPAFLTQLVLLNYQKENFSEILSFSQEGEDKILDRYFENKNFGFYVDIGAHHPIRFSNTHLFYLKGWSGINIDATPGSMEAFKQMRQRDINLEIPISSEVQILKYYIFNEPALNTFVKGEAVKKNDLKDYSIIETINIQTYPLSQILDKYLPIDQSIDFMSIDVEGLDFDVLKSNNWAKYSPYIILIESLESSLEDISKNEVFIYLKQLNYTLVAKTYNTLFFKRK